MIDPIALESEVTPRDQPATNSPDASAERSVGDDGVIAAVQAIHAMVDERVAAVLTAFDEKVARDRHKEVLIDKLHAELLVHKSDVVGLATRPLKQSLIRLHDDLGKTLEHYRRAGLSELTAERALSLIENFQTQVEIALEESGVAAYREDGDRFQAKRQRALCTVPTTDDALVGTVAERLRPGFEEGATVLEKERVAVYAQAPKLTQPNEPETTRRPQSEEKAE